MKKMLLSFATLFLVFGTTYADYDRPGRAILNQYTLQCEGWSGVCFYHKGDSKEPTSGDIIIINTENGPVLREILFVNSSDDGSIKIELTEGEDGDWNEFDF